MNTYKRHRFSRDIISYAVWLYYRFNLSHRDIEDLLLNEASSYPENQSACGVLNSVLYTIEASLIYPMIGNLFAVREKTA